MIDTVTKNYLDGEFANYKVTYVNSEIVQFVPINADNTDYQAIQEWAAIDGNNIIDNGA